MRLSSQGRFAVTALIDVALREESGPVPLNDISSRQHISVSYLEQLFSKMRVQGLVSSVRGPGGGYLLGRRSEVITVADIICAVEGLSPKTKSPDVALAQDLTTELWDSVNAKVLEFAQSVTLKSLVLDQLAIGVKTEQKTSPNRGVFKKPDQPSVRSGVPNSVFALDQTSRARG